MAEGVVMQRRTIQFYHGRRRARRGAALVFCMFILSFVVLMVVNVVDTATLELSALRNSLDYERALYLANAGIHHAAAEIEANNAWRGTVADGAYPADNTYFAEAIDGPDSTVIVTASGAAGDVKRTIQSTIEL
jgi:Tfp pilus assembly protein PilX